MRKSLRKIINKSTNVYRTENYIVAQDIHFITKDNGHIGTYSRDLYIRRNPKLDKRYARLVKKKGKDLNGQRYRSYVYSRRFM